MFQNKPVIGITGGIGSGKSTVAHMFADLGCLVINADELVQQAYLDPAVLREIQVWWGDKIVGQGGQVDKSKIADIVFNDPGQRQKLEALLHPKVAELRDRRMLDAGRDSQVPAFVWDMPLLFEAGLRGGCDAIVFVEAPLIQRLARVCQSRGWSELELHRREKSQWPLDKKREISDYIIDNTADAEFIRSQVREVLSRILVKRFPEQS